MASRTFSAIRMLFLHQLTPYNTTSVTKTFNTFPTYIVFYIFLLIYNLFKDPVSSSECTALNRKR